MCKSLSIILVATLATTSAFAAKPRYYGSTAPKSYTVKNPVTDRTTSSEKKMAEEEGYDLKKMTKRLKNGSAK